MKPCGLFVICCLLALGHAPSVCGKVTLVNNGYEGVTVYIAGSVSEDLTLINNIKNAFRDASDHLFYATKNRAFFRHISIVIPRSWTGIVTNGTVPTVDKFDGYIRVDKPAVEQEHMPYTRGNVECGRGAWYTHLTPAFLNGDYNGYFGRPGKTIVHEWGHLRWGLFDEYPSIVTKSTAPYKVAYSNGGGKWNPVTCSKQVTGNALQGNCDPNKPCPIDNVTMKRFCKFCPNQAQSATSSIMASQWIETVINFCEKDDDQTPASVRHDSTAPNLQNQKCNQRSAWEVMEEHEDFRDGNNPATSISSFEEPTFQIVKESTKIRVFVYDVSGSMSGSKIIKQADASYVVIDRNVEIGSYLALVSFESNASTLVGLTEVLDDSVRETLKQRVPTYADGGTDIYKGLYLAIQVIEARGFATSGAEIVLLSDGRSAPYLNISSTLIQKGIIVHTIAITNAADANMARLAAETGGKSYTYLETSSVSFADVFKQATTSNSPSASTSVEILSSSLTLSTGSPVTGVFYIDEGLGSGTTVTIIQTSTYSVSVSVTVQAPNGTLYSKQGSSRVLTLKLDGISQVGEYNYTISTTTNSVSIEVMVSSVPTSDDVDTIQVTSFVNSSTLDFDDQNQVRLSASVQKGTAAVLNANVTAVLAADTFFTPLYLALTDTGTGADAIYGDGIYSTYLLKKYFTRNSGYNIKVSVQGHGEAYTQSTTTNGADAIPGTVDDTDVTTTTVGSFTRDSVPGEVSLANYVSNPADTTPPSQITDLLVEDITKVSIDGVASMIYTLSWTAPGSDMDIGQATEYDMRLNPDIQFLRDDFTQSSVVPVELPVPKISGSTESINVTFNQDHCMGICYLALTAKDETGLTSDISNIINIDIDFRYVAVTTVINFPKVDGSEKEQSIVLVLVLSLLATAIVLVILALVVYKFLHGKSKKGALAKGKIDTYEDPIYIVEQGDGCEILRFQYYNQDSVDAVIPFSNADFNSRPTFSMNRIANTFDKRDNSWFDDETGNVHRPTEEKIRKCKNTFVVPFENEETQRGSPFSTNKADEKSLPKTRRIDDTLPQNDLHTTLFTHDADDTTPEEGHAVEPDCLPEASANVPETVGESDNLDPLFAVDRSEINAKHAG